MSEGLGAEFEFCTETLKDYDFVAQLISGSGTL